MTEFRNQKLRDAFARYAKVVLDIVSKRLEAGEELTVMSDSAWYYRGDMLIREEYDKPLWIVLIHRLDKVLASSPEYRECAKLLSEDPVVARQLNTLVGTRDNRTALSTEDLISRFICDVIEDKQRPLFDADIVDRRYKLVENALYSEEIVIEELAPVFGLETTSPEVVLNDDVKISTLTPDDIRYCISMGLFRIEPPGGFVFNPPRFAVKVRLREPKVLGDWEPGAAEQTIKHYAQAAEWIREVLQALRLFKPGQCFMGGLVRRPVNWLVSYAAGVGGGQWPRIPWLAKYALEDIEIGSFKQFWAVLRSSEVKSRGFLEVAITRFGYAKDRNLPEDQLIDLMIASEALFLCDVTDDQYRGELRYRLALRAGLFIGKTAVEQKEIFREMRSAYDARSAVVHGGKPRVPAGFQSLTDFVNRIEEYLREALKKATLLAAKTGTPRYLVDWDELVFERKADDSV